MAQATKITVAISFIAILVAATSSFYAIMLQNTVAQMRSETAALSDSLNQLSEALGISSSDYAKLLISARKEGQLVWYTSLALRDSQPVVEKFAQRFPFIRTELVRKSSEDVLQLALVEARAGNQRADVWQTGLLETFQLSKDVPLVKLDKKITPELSAFRADQIEKDGRWATIRVNTFGVGFNTKLVNRNEIPKTWEGFLDAKWKGKMAVEAEDYNWFANLQQILGAQKAADLLKGLAANGIQLRKGHTTTMELVAAGEIAVMINANTQRAEELKRRGAPVDWVAIEPIPTELHVVSIFEKAPHPAAARLFVNWLLSVEGQTTIAAEFRIPARAGIPVNPPNLVEGLKLFYADSSWLSHYEEVVKLWKQTFGIP